MRLTGKGDYMRTVSVRSIRAGLRGELARQLAAQDAIFTRHSHVTGHVRR